jgi:hypothetical protein
MAQYSNNTLCFISFTKLPSDTPLYELHKVISFGFVVDYEDRDNRRYHHDDDC